MSSDEYPIILQVVWVDELHGQIDILYNNNSGYLEFLTTSDGGAHWKQAGIYQPKFEDSSPVWLILDSYRSRIKDDYESMSLDNSGVWKLDGRYGDPDTNIIVIQHQVFTQDGSLKIKKIVLPKQFDFINGEIIAPQAR